MDTIANSAAPGLRNLSASSAFFGGRQGRLYPVKQFNHLALFLLAQGPQPHLFMLMNDRAKVPGDLPSRIGQLDQKHPPVGTMRGSLHVTAPFKRVKQARHAGPADDKALSYFVGRQGRIGIRQGTQNQPAGGREVKWTQQIRNVLDDQVGREDEVHCSFGGPGAGVGVAFIKVRSDIG